MNKQTNKEKKKKKLTLIIIKIKTFEFFLQNKLYHLLPLIVFILLIYFYCHLTYHISYITVILEV